jgi:hydroxypyruvate reductase
MSKDLLRALFDSGIAAVGGRQSVGAACCELNFFKPGQIISVGKAADAMLQGAFDVYGDMPALLVTKHHHCSSQIRQRPNVQCIEAGHPISDKHSLVAGKTLLAKVQACKEPLLLLVSGGASAVAECLVEGMTLENWQAHNRELLASGKDIAQINHWRKQQSRIKDGRLLAHYSGPEVVVLAISDVQGDNLSVIGSGVGEINRTAAKASAQLIASNKIARDAVARAATAKGLAVVHNQQSLHDDVYVLSQRVYEKLTTGEPGIYIFGGEPTIQLPPQPGNGGRAQSLALSLAQKIQGMNKITILVAGTDGSDGPTDAAGAIVDGQTCLRLFGAERALRCADAGSYLRQVGDILITGPTGTNVMDLVIAVINR